MAREADAWHQQLFRGVQRIRKRVVSGFIGDKPTSILPERFSAKRVDGDACFQARTFEFADFMEQGIAPGASSEFIRPPDGRSGQEERQLFVQCDPTGQSFLLVTEDDEALLLARPRSPHSSPSGVCRRRIIQTASCLSPSGASATSAGFDIFVTHDGKPPLALGPAFSLNPMLAGGGHFSLTSLRCEECASSGRRSCGVRQLARITHYNEPVGEGKAHCMDVELPKLGDDGHQDVWCTKCGTCTVGDRRTELSTRRPRWSPKRRSLVMDFHGRCSLGSAKNFQLDYPGKERSKSTEMLFGKVAEDRFVLYYREPLGAVQAFAVALTSLDRWFA
eukprot:TRINITY_DN30662_c0_g1_i1.p1 TRINITY_DN30662_c0_g1~~TRINITY_DN30662_c0_g1_i1.p1  ORF type:complete len:334 (-),score=41.82 TRINITY_DN30662_c0_g1_i1:74-1075(-)